MSEQSGEKKKVSIADALEQLRQGKASNGPSATAQAAAASQRAQRIPPAFWLQNLQDSIQRRRDTLYESIVEDASAKGGLQRRDLVPLDTLYLPQEMVNEVEAPLRPERPTTVADVSRYQDIEVLSLDRQAPVHESVEAPAPEMPAPVVVHNEASQGLSGRFDSVEALDLNTLGGVEQVGSAEVARVLGGSNPTVEMLDLGAEGIEFEEVKTEQREDGPKKFKVNPMFRQMFQNLGNE